MVSTTPPERELLRRRRAFAGRLLRWYDANRRNLPWRRAPTPYRVLVSEVMLQQTRAESVAPYYRRFLRRFPEIDALARAEETEVLSLWEGLGYYRRAHNLLRAARQISKGTGAFPRSARALQELPGIGPYTAAALASIAFGESEPALDGNGERVLARMLALERPPARARRSLRRLLRAMMPKARAGDFNQALMELGATVCTPRRPACPRCPVRQLCRARRLAKPDAYPRRAARRPSPLRAEEAVLVRWGGRVLLRRRPAGGLLGGLWAVPAYGKATPLSARDRARERSSERTLEAFRRELGFPLRLEAKLPSIHHIYSHFKLTLTPLVCSPRAEPPPPVAPDAAVLWFESGAVSALPMGRVDRRILELAPPI